MILSTFGLETVDLYGCIQLVLLIHVHVCVIDLDIIVRVSICFFYVCDVEQPVDLPF